MLIRKKTKKTKNHFFRSCECTVLHENHLTPISVGFSLIVYGFLDTKNSFLPQFFKNFITATLVGILGYRIYSFFLYVYILSTLFKNVRVYLYISSFIGYSKQFKS